MLLVRLDLTERGGNIIITCQWQGSYTLEHSMLYCIFPVKLNDYSAAIEDLKIAT